MDLLKQMADGIIILVRVGAVFRVIFCLIKISANEEETENYKKRLKNVIVFYILAESVWLLKDLITGYF